MLIPRLWWIDLVGRVETMKPWLARFKCCHMRGKITEYWLTETEDIFCFLNNEGTSSNQEGMINWCWLSFFAVCGDDLLIQFNWMKQCNLTNCTPPHMRDCNLPAVFSRRTEKHPVTCMIRPNEARKDYRVHEQRLFLGLPSPRRSYKSHNTFDSQRDNRSVLCGWSVRLCLELPSTSRSWKKNLPVALRGIDSTKKKKIGTNSHCFRFVEN